uniref:Uncharacterized protein n=1 Tax=Calcidiscus leptoporus TaxID=127549 RepID=A0A7S0J6B6_9EUKA
MAAALITGTLCSFVFMSTLILWLAKGGWVAKLVACLNGVASWAFLAAAVGLWTADVYPEGGEVGLGSHRRFKLYPFTGSILTLMAAFLNFLAFCLSLVAVIKPILRSHDGVGRETAPSSFL